jgi:hypothetical protein
MVEWPMCGLLNLVEGIVLGSAPGCFVEIVKSCDIRLGFGRIRLKHGQQGLLEKVVASLYFDLRC